MPKPADDLERAPLQTSGAPGRAAYNVFRAARLRKFQIGVTLAHLAQVIAASVYVALDTGWGQLHIRTRCYSYPIAWLLPAFSACSCISHALTAYKLPRILEIRVNRVRWVEYSISSTLCNWVVCTLVGIDELTELVILSIINVGVMWTGEVAERRVSQGRSALVPLLVGWVGFAIEWGVILAAFGHAVHTREPEKGPVPAFVLYGVPTGLVALNSLFGLVAVLYAFPPTRRCRALMNDADRFLYAEYAYSILSLTAKSFLTWMVLGGAQRPDVTVCKND